DDFIRPMSKIAWLINLQQRVSTPKPPPILQIGLCNDADAGSHRVERSLEPTSPIEFAFIQHHVIPTIFEVLHVCGFMSESALLKRGKAGIMMMNAIDLSSR